MIPDGLPSLAYGAHDTNKGEACVMEYISLLAGEEWTDMPSCTNPLLAVLAQSLNDYLHNSERNKVMVPFIPRLMGTHKRGFRVNQAILQAVLDRSIQACHLCKAISQHPCPFHRKAQIRITMFCSDMSILHSLTGVQNLLMMGADGHRGLPQQLFPLLEAALTAYEKFTAHEPEDISHAQVARANTLLTAV